MDDLNYDPDTLVTAYRNSISELYLRNGITPCEQMEDFSCAYRSKCSSKPPRPELVFHTGTWPYVGALYGNARVQGNPVRILFVAMERGGKFTPAEEKTFADTQYDFRYSAEQSQNPHMGGVSQLMKALVDNEDKKKSSILFALTNAVKCVWGTNSMDSDSTDIMIQNCADHLQAEIAVLKPHLIITQGVHPTNTIRRLLPARTSIADFTGDAGTSSLFVCKNIVVLTTPHPARKKGWAWKS